jgi:hypothetical protein
MRQLFYAVLAIAVTATQAHADDAAPDVVADAAAEPGDATGDAVEAPKETGRPTEKGTLGLGLIFGEPTGISAKLYLADDRAVQGAVGGSFYADAWQLHGEYVLHPWILQDRDTFVLPVYVGPGMRFMYYNEGRDGDAHFAIGLRGVIGMLFDFKTVPLDVFVEVAGVIEYDFDDGFGPGLNVGAGIRYYF